MRINGALWCTGTHECRERRMRRKNSSCVSRTSAIHGGRKSGLRSSCHNVDGDSLMPTLPRKQSVNVSIDRALLRAAPALHLNLSKTLEERLAELVRHAERGQWLKKNREALEEYNQRIEQAGVYSDGLRRF